MPEQAIAAADLKKCKTVETVAENKGDIKQEERKLSKKELISYGLGGVAATMPSTFKNSFAMNFMSDVAGLHVGGVGVLNMLLTIWDAINDPIIGGIADHTNTKRWGKYRPHMLMGTICWAAVMMALFSVPNLSQTGKWIYYIVMLALYSVFFTQFTVPWQALNSVMSKDPQERNILLTCRQYGGFIAGTAVGVITMPLVGQFENAKTGWLVAVGVVCVCLLITGFMAANGAKKVDYYNSIPTPPKVNFKSQINLITKNRAVLCAALLLGFVFLSSTINSAISLYYLKYVAKNLKILSITSLVGMGISIVFIPMMPSILKRLGKVKSVGVGMFINMFTAAGLIFLRENATALQIILMSFVSSIGFTMANVSVLAMIPDCTDYTEWKFGTAQAGFINAAITFVKKFCSSFSTLIVGVALAAVGYAAGEEISQQMVDTIINIKIISPISLFVMTLILLKAYPITPAFAREMRETLKVRRAERAAKV